MNKISSLTEFQLPRYIVEEYPKFVLFLETFYKYLEQDGYAIDILINQQKYDDIDRTLDKFVPYFKQQYAESFPDVALVDKRLMIKHIKDFYLTKGTEESFKIFFRMVFDIKIQVSYPQENILKASDGILDNKIVIRVARNTGDPFLFSGTKFDFINNSQQVIKSAFCESVISFVMDKFLVYELTLKDSDINFTYVDIDQATKITAVVGTQTIVADLYNMVVDTVVTNAGLNYQSGDEGEVVGTGSGALISVFRTNIADGSIIDISIDDFGVGYTPSGTLNFKWGLNNLVWSNLGTTYNLVSVNTIQGVFGDTGNTLGRADIILGKMAIYKNKYSGSTGQLSSDMRLHDNFYYQIHSYVIDSTISYDEWEKAVRDNVHIAGSKAFSSIRLNNIHTIYS